MATKFKNGINVTKSITITSAVATDNPLVVKPASGQSANLVEFRDIANNTVSQITFNGSIGMGSGTLISAGNGRGLFIVSSDAVPLTARGASGQTNNLQEWQNSSGTVLAAIESGGAVRLPYRAITGARILDATDYTIDCTANSFTVTLPTAVGITGRIYNIKNTGTGTITVDGNAAETIDGALTVTLTGQYQSITIQSTGSGWIIL